MVVALVAVTASCGYGFLWSAQRADATARADMQDRAARAARAVTASVDEVTKTVESLAGQPAIATILQQPAAACSLSAEGTRAFPSARIDLVRADGRVTCSSSDSAEVFAAGLHARARWLSTATPRTRVNWNETDASTGQRAVVIAAGVTAGGRTIGAVAVFLGVPTIGSALAADLAGSNATSFTVIDRTGGFVLSSSERPDGIPPDGGSFAAQPAAGQWAGVDGSVRLFASTPLAEGNWRVYAGVPRGQVLAQARGALIRQAAVGLLVLLLLGSGAWLVNRQIAGPLRAVTQAAAKAIRDPQDERVAEVGPQELVTLARQFNTMLDVRAGFEAELTHRATHDSLTGLPNRALLLDRLQHAIRGAPDIGGTQAVLCLGINRFNILNDSLGPAGADQVLIQVAGLLEDELGPDHLLARHNGAEFLILCNLRSEVPGDSAGEATRIAARLFACLDRTLSGPAAEVVLSASVGVAIASRRTSPEQLLREANSAMYQARIAVTGCSVFDESSHVRANAHLEIERDLRLALERQELVVYYQPLLEISTHTIVGAEALVRWQHPRRGLISPVDFIPVAEETGQIVALGAYVLAEACRQTAAWAATGHPLRISVNVAVDQLRHGFPETVRDALDDSRLDPHHLCLELTESVLIRTAGEGGTEFTRLRDLGVHLAIDDFGTGYSSLSYLHDLPVTELKIDRSFITRLDDRPREGHLVEAIIGMSHALGLDVVAEGVETGTQLGYLEDLGCGLAQGFLIAAPQPAERFLALLDLERAGSPMAHAS